MPPPLPRDPRAPISESKLELHASAIITTTPAAAQDFFSFCQRVNPREFEKILKEGQLLQFGADSVIYLQGEPGDSFYVVNDGVVEVIAADEQRERPIPISYLSKGEIFGEIGLLLDVPRTTSVRVPEKATLLRFSQDAFRRLISDVPAFGHYLSVLLARRLHKTTMQLYFYGNSRELSGSLDFFDMPTIFQTLGLSQQNGVMHIFSMTSEVMGEFAFAQGAPISGRYEHLYGMEALLQLFLLPPKANFGFTRSAEVPVVENPLQIENVNEFMMNAAHLRDEMAMLQAKLQLTDEQPVKRVHARLDWKDEESMEGAHSLWKALMPGPMALKDLAKEVPYCRYNLLRILDQLFQTGQLDKAEITPYGYR